MNELRIGAGFLGAISSVNDVEHLRHAARVCEDGGLASFWVADQRWQRDVYVSLTDIAARTGLAAVGNAGDRPVHQASGPHRRGHRDPR